MWFFCVIATFPIDAMGTHRYTYNIYLYIYMYMIIPPLINHYASIRNLIHHSSFIIHHSSFIIHHSSVIIHHSSFIIHHSPFTIHHSSSFIFIFYLSFFFDLLPRCFSFGPRSRLVFLYPFMFCLVSFGVGLVGEWVGAIQSLHWRTYLMVCQKNIWYFHHNVMLLGAASKKNLALAHQLHDS